MCPTQSYFLIILISIQIYSISLTPIQDNELNQMNNDDCCLAGKKYATIKQDFQHFIQLDQLNLDRRRKSTALDQIMRQTNLVKLFSKIHLNRHFYTNSSICEIKDKILIDQHLPTTNDECQIKFTDCCLDTQLQFAIGIDLALRTRFQQIKITNDHNQDQNVNHEIEYLYSISKANEIRLNCNLLINKTNLANKTIDEQMESIKMIHIGENVAFDSCDACSFGIESMDQFESCSLIDENRRNLQRNELWSIIFKQCCRIIHLSKVAETQGFIKIQRMDSS